MTTYPIGSPAWEEEAALEALRTYAQEHGRPTYNGWTPAPEGCPSTWTLQKRFGSWRKAMVAAGLEDVAQGKGNKPAREA